MRLTLRAILAYLDDVLDPSKLKEIGAKISESPAAAATVSRIKEVVRRRRIAAPELSGPGSAPDPNIVAEYLDNTLDASAVPALEKLCLDSDMHLAEVAASHQILTAVLGEPIDVPVTTRERMYALVSPAPLVSEPPLPSELPATKPVSVAQAPLLHTSSPPVSADYLRPAGGRRLLGAVLGLLVAAGWLGWVLVDQGVIPMPGAPESVAMNDPHGPKTPESTSPQAEKGAIAEKDASSEAGNDLTSEMPDEASVVSADGQIDGADGEPANTVATTTPNVSGSEPAHDETELAANMTTEGPLGDVESASDSQSESDSSQAAATSEDNALEMAALPSGQLASVEPSNEVVPAEPPMVEAEVPMTEFPDMLYTSSEGLLLIHDRQPDQWTVMPRRSVIHAGDELAAPDPFESDLTIEGSPLEITLFGGSRVTLETAAAPSLFTLGVNRGRISLSRPLSSEQGAPVSVRLNLRGKIATLTLNEPGTQCGLEVGQRAPLGQAPDPLLLLPEGGLFVAVGDASISWEGGEPLPVGANVGWAAWPIPPQPITAGPVRAIPPWLSPEGVSLTAADRKWHQMFEKEFATDQAVSMSIPALILDRRERISSLATYTLGVVDDIPSLVRALQSDYEETRLAAIWCLRGWLPSSPVNAEILRAEVQRTFPDDEVEQIVELLWGYSTSDAQDPMISKRLITWMDHKNITIRELAFFHVTRLTGRISAHGYRPNLPESPRNAALMGWRNHLERNGGQLMK